MTSRIKDYRGSCLDKQYLRTNVDENDDTICLRIKFFEEKSNQQIRNNIPNDTQLFSVGYVVIQNDGYS